MKSRLRQWSLGSLAGGLIGGGLFAALWAVRFDSDLAAQFSVSEAVLLVAVAGAVAGGIVAFVVGRLNRRPIVPIVQAPPAPAPSLPPATPVVPAAKPKRRQAPFVGRLCAARLTPDLRWQKVSLSLQKLLDISGKKLRGTSILDLIHADDRIVIERRFLNPSKIAFDAKFRVTLSAKKGKDGAVLYIQMTAAPLRDEQGKLSAWRVLWFDMTRQVEGEEARQNHLAELAQAQEKWQRIQRQLDRLKDSYFDLYHNAPVMYFSLDAEGKFVTFNDTLLRTLGYERNDLLGRKYTDMVSILGSTPVSFEIPSDKQEEWETQWRRKDGSPLDVWLRTVGVFDENDKFVRWRSSALDFTERNRLANQLRAHSEELENTNSRLRHINSELEDFTHVVSHDLKEPLRTIQLYSNLLAEDFSSQLSTDGFQSVNYLLQASRRLGLLIDDLLNLSQAGRAAKAPRPFNLIEAVATVRRDLVDLIQRKEAIILTEGTLPAVVGDPQRITQLLTNLVANGLKYNKHAAPRVTIGQALQGADDRQAIIFVRDNGIGIDPKDHQKIFGLFRRLNHQDEFEGTGAGLTICKKIVEAHGGRIWIDSAPGQGATFYFTLPKAAPRAVPKGTVRTVPSEAPASPRTSGPGKHVLLVEDLQEYGEIIQRLGRRSGLRITWYKTAEEAWDWLQEARPDFLLLDVKLPGMSGAELCRRIRSELSLEAPIALYSQESLSDDQLREIGADYFLSKELLTQPVQWQKRLNELIAARLVPVGADT
jgi:PAS domain S-box-containing protein